MIVESGARCESGWRRDKRVDGVRSFAERTVLDGKFVPGRLERPRRRRSSDERWTVRATVGDVSETNGEPTPVLRGELVRTRPSCSVVTSLDRQKLSSASGHGWSDRKWVGVSFPVIEPCL